jgi:hypothetical protein
MAKIILEKNNSFAIGPNSSDSVVYGAAGIEKVILAAGSYASIDQNVERTELSGASSSYTYVIAGNKIIVNSGSTPVATIIGGNGNKTIAFSDGSAILSLTGLNKATLGGKTIPTTASALSDITLNTTDKSVFGTNVITLAANLTALATPSADTFQLPSSLLLSGAYATSISGFNVLQDHLQVPKSTALPQIDANASVNNVIDGNVDFIWNNGNLVTVHLTGLTNSTHEELLQAGTAVINSVVADTFGFY